jgi:alcohol dehydrogenase
MLCAGICNTDLELQRGYYGFAGVPGHEFVGEVVEADTADLIGRRVVGEINLGCCACEWCKLKLERHCPHRTVLGIVKHPGAFQEFFTLPERNLHIVPDSIPTEAAVFTEPLAAACEILDQIQFPCSSQIAVLGDGKLGLLIAQALNAYGLKIHQFGRHADKLRISEKAGVHTEVASELPAAAYNWVVDATGSPEGLQQAIRMVRPRGTVILKSTQHGLVGVDTAPVIVNEITLVGSRCGRFEPALDLLSRGLINVQDMISGWEKLADAPRAFERAARKGTMKVLLT